MFSWEQEMPQVSQGSALIHQGEKISVPDRLGGFSWSSEIGKPNKLKSCLYPARDSQAQKLHQLYYLLVPVISLFQLSRYKISRTHDGSRVTHNPSAMCLVVWFSLESVEILLSDSRNADWCMCKLAALFLGEFTWCFELVLMQLKQRGNVALWGPQDEVRDGNLTPGSRRADLLWYYIKEW